MVADDVYMYVRMCLRIYVCMRYARACKLTAWQCPPACPSRCLPVFARSVRPVSATVSAALPADVIGFGKRRMMERKKKSKKRKSKKENNNNNIIN